MTLNLSNSSKLSNPFRLAALVLCTWAAAGSAAAQQPATNQAPATLSEERPATLIVWNRPLAVFRITFDSVAPQQRANSAAERIEAALETLAPEQTRFSLVQIGSNRGVVIGAGGELLFGIHERDHPQDAATSLEAAGPQALMRDRAEQRRWPTCRAPKPKRSRA
jgi:hypothetical protein